MAKESMSAAPAFNLGSLAASLASVTDPRVVGRTAHDLGDVLAIAIGALMAGASGWDDMEEWASHHRATLALWLDLRGGVPSGDTLRRVLSAIDFAELSACFQEWAAGIPAGCAPGAPRVVALDGKCVRGSRRPSAGRKLGIHQLSAYVAGQGICLAQRDCSEEKSNEIAAIKNILPSLDLAGAIVTIDAMGTHADIASLVAAGGGDWLLPIKGNQPLLEEAVGQFFGWWEIGRPEGHGVAEFIEGLEVEHGRESTRRCLATSELSWMGLMGLGKGWTGLRSIAMVESEGVRDGKPWAQRRIYLSSMAADPAAILAASRAHWSIENGLHWVLDVAFGEDACRVWNMRAAKNLSLLRKIAFNLLRGWEPSAKACSMPKKMKMVDRDAGHAMSLISQLF